MLLLLVTNGLSLVTRLVGLGRFELPTSPLSGVRSNHLSYRPKSNLSIFHSILFVRPVCYPETKGFSHHAAKHFTK